jgi:hypothetical protein
VKQILVAFLLAVAATLGPIVLRASGADPVPSPPPAVATAVQMVVPRQTPTPVPGPDIIPVGQVVQIAVTGMSADLAKKSATTVYPRKSVIFYPAQGWDASFCILFSAQTPGTYLVGIYSPGTDGGVVKAEVELVVGTPGPAPGPTPGPPVPPVPPTPPSKPIALVSVCGLAGVPTKAVWSDPSVVALLTAHGCTVTSYAASDVANPLTSDDELKFIGQAFARAGGKLPLLLLTADDGTVLWTGPPPATAAALVSELTPMFGKD